MARTRSDPQGPRPARRVGVHRAHLRRVHRRARARLGARGGRRDRNQDPEEREHHPQPDARDAVLAGSPGPFLPSACARLGRHRFGAQGRSEADLRDPADRSPIIRTRRPRISATCRTGSRNSSRAVSWGSSRTPTGAIPRTSCRRKSICWRRRTISRRSTSRRTSSRCRRSSAARIRTRTGSWAACRARSTSTAPARSARTTWRCSTWSATSATARRISSTRSTFPTCWRSRATTRTGRSGAAGFPSQNVLSYGEFPEIPNDYSNASLGLPSGVIIGGDLKNVQDVDLKDPEQVQEWVTHSWYKYADESKGLHPFDGVTDAELRPRAEHQGLAHRHQGDRRRREVLLGEVAAMEGPSRSRSARSHAIWSPTRADARTSRSRSTARSRRSTFRCTRSSRRSAGRRRGVSNASGPRIG